MSTLERHPRPWPLPPRPWIMAMEWRDLLFAHWPIAPAAMQALLPPGLELDTYDGQAWLGVVPFEMTGVRPRAIPALPWVSRFAELNVRTYVVVDGKPGVWFFSLDAAQPLAVRGARWGFHLPYFDAQMHIERGDGIRYQSQRTHRGAAPATFAASYRPTGPVYHSQPGTLEQWLTDRYCLYATDDRGHVWRGDIHHARWPLQPASAMLSVNTMGDWIGLDLSAPPSLLHFVRYLAVVAWWPERLR